MVGTESHLASLRSAVEECRREGLKAGLFRPITCWPFPTRALQNAAAKVQRVLVVELSNGQMVEDVRLALNGRGSNRFLQPCRWERPIR